MEETGNDAQKEVLSCSVPRKSAGLAGVFVEEGRHPRERRVPVDRDLVGRPGLDMIDETLLGSTALQPDRLRIRILQAGVRPT